MALPDLLWACPECREDRGLEPHGGRYRCRGCGTEFERAEGARIRATLPSGAEIVRRPAEWLARLPDPQVIVEQRVDSDEAIRRATVDMSRVVGSDTVHDRDGYLNRIELWGDEAPATLELFRDRLLLTPELGRPESWPLQTVTAVQASSSSLQINRRAQPLASFRFRDDSIFLWEQLMHVALRDFYARTGRGEIVEFQPRIATA